MNFKQFHIIYFIRIKENNCVRIIFTKEEGHGDSSFPGHFENTYNTFLMSILKISF